MKWEYFVAPLLEHNPGEILNNFGEDGWELVTILQQQTPAGRRLDGRLHEATGVLGCARRMYHDRPCGPRRPRPRRVGRHGSGMSTGLRFAPGGHHPQWGTANMIAPLGNDYLELLGVVDEEVGSSSVLGRTLMELSADGDRWFSVCLADDDIDATAARLGLTVRPGARDAARRDRGAVARRRDRGARG